MIDEDEIEYRRLARAEALERVKRIERALAANRYDEVFRHAHSIAGFARDLDGALADAARRLAARLRDERGHQFERLDEAAVRQEARSLDEALQRVVSGS